MILAARILVILASVLLVAAVGLAALTPRGLTLDQGVALLDPAASPWLHSRLAVWVQEPFLDRPVWFVPASLGLVCAGVAASLNLSRPPQSHRRRS